MVARFVGGPLHGELREIPDSVPRIAVPICPELNWESDPSLTVGYRTGYYVRKADRYYEYEGEQ